MTRGHFFALRPNCSAQNGQDVVAEQSLVATPRPLDHIDATNETGLDGILISINGDILALKLKGMKIVSIRRRGEQDDWPIELTYRFAHLLRNRFYIGEVVFKGDIRKGEQSSIIDRDLFDTVQAKLEEQQNNHTTKRMQSDALLIGRIFDDRGNRMSPSHARKVGIKYRYYLSSALLNGLTDSAGSVPRVAAETIEKLVIKSLQEHLGLEQQTDDRAIISAHVSRVEIRSDEIVVHLARAEEPNASSQPIASGKALHIPWQKTPSKRRREILVPEGVQSQHARPIRSENRATLVADFVVKVGRLLMSGGFLGFRSTLIHALEAVRRAVEGRLGRTRVGDWWRSSDQLCQAP